MSAARPAATNPYPGLRPFQPDEEHLFFGREGQLDDLLGRLRRTRFVAVVGGSGSGKSSLVRAGLLPALHGGFMAGAGSRWRIAVVRPGLAPIANLAEALAVPGALGGDAASTHAVLRRGALGVVDAVQRAKTAANENVLIVVDQFEELFRFAAAAGTRHGDEAAAFVKLLLAAAAAHSLPIFVVLTMRSDFVGDCARFRDLPEAINDGMFLLPRMTRDELRRAVEGPAGVAGTPIAARLTTRLLNELGDDQDQLPVLQHALMRTWTIWEHDHARGEPLDLRHLDDAGGLAEALSRHADEVYKSLPDSRARAVSARLFQALTELGPDNRGVRRPTRFADACAIVGCEAAELSAVVEAFRAPERAFLTPPAGTRLDADTVLDVSHESLMRTWARLQRWVADEAESARIYRRLAQAAALNLRGEAALWRDPDLSIALAWRERAVPNPAWGRRYDRGFDDAMRFLDESAAAREAELERRARARRRQLQSLRAFAAVLGGLFVVSAIAAWWGMLQRDRARLEAKRATVAAVSATEARRRADAFADAEHRAALAAQRAQLRALAAARSERDAERAAVGAKLAAQHSAVAARRSAVEARRSAANGQYDAGLAYLARNEYGAALASLDRAVTTYEALGERAREAAAVAARGQIAALRGDERGALAEYAHALQLDPRNVDTYVDRSLTEDAMGEHARALADADAALAIAPSAAGYVARAHARADAPSPRYPEALDDYGRALALATPKERAADEAVADRAKQDAANAYAGRAQILAAERNYAGALADADAALRANPADADAFVERAAALRAEGRPADAAAASYAALALQPSNAAARRELALAQSGAAAHPAASPAPRVAAIAPPRAPRTRPSAAVHSAPLRPAPPAPMVAAAGPPHGRSACDMALDYEREAAQDAIPRQEAYDMALIGLRANDGCGDDQRHLVNEAYLLSLRAPAEHDLQIGDWRADLREANALLARCAVTPGIAGTRTAEDCRTQQRYNERFANAYPAARVSMQPDR